MPFLTYDPFPQCLQQSPLTPLLLARVTSEEVGAIYQTLSVSTNHLADEALSSYINENAWQVEAIRKAVEQADRGGPFVAMEDVKRWVESWGTDHELPPPEATITR